MGNQSPLTPARRGLAAAIANAAETGKIYERASHARQRAERLLAAEAEAAGELEAAEAEAGRHVVAWATGDTPMERELPASQREAVARAKEVHRVASISAVAARSALAELSAAERFEGQQHTAATAKIREAAHLVLMEDIAPALAARFQAAQAAVAEAHARYDGFVDLMLRQGQREHATTGGVLGLQAVERLGRMRPNYQARSRAATTEASQVWERFADALLRDAAAGLEA